MTDTKYLLLPQWILNDRDGEQDFDIPPYFMKLFDSKKDIVDYLENNDIRRELNQIKDQAFCDWVDRRGLTGQERQETLLRMFAYSDIIFWVIGINPVGKGNRIGMMQRRYEENKPKWKYVSYFGGKVWKDQLLFGVYR